MGKDDMQIKLNEQSIRVLSDGQIRQEVMLEKIDKRQIEMFNHFTEKYEKIFTELKERLPKWASMALGVLCIMLGALAQGLL